MKKQSKKKRKGGGWDCSGGSPRLAGWYWVILKGEYRGAIHLMRFDPYENVGWDVTKEQSRLTANFDGVDGWKPAKIPKVPDFL